MEGMSVEDGDILIARLWRWDVDRLVMDAEWHHNDLATAAKNEWDPDGEGPLDYAVSAFGLVKTADDDVEGLMKKVCQATKRSARYVSFTTMSELRSHNIRAILSEPPPDHYDLSLGTTLVTSDVEVLARIFDSRPKRRFPGCEVIAA